MDVILVSIPLQNLNLAHYTAGEFLASHNIRIL